MSAFEIVHQDRVVGKLSCFDRLIFKGHLSGLFPDGAFAYFLHSQDVLLKDFGRYVKQMTDQLKGEAISLCGRAAGPTATCPRPPPVPDRAPPSRSWLGRSPSATGSRKA